MTMMNALLNTKFQMKDLEDKIENYILNHLDWNEPDEVKDLGEIASKVADHYELTDEKVSGMVGKITVGLYIHNILRSLSNRNFLVMRVEEEDHWRKKNIKFEDFTLSYLDLAKRYDVWNETTKQYMGRGETLAEAKDVARKILFDVILHTVANTQIDLGSGDLFKYIWRIASIESRKEWLHLASKISGYENIAKENPSEEHPIFYHVVTEGLGGAFDIWIRDYCQKLGITNIARPFYPDGYYLTKIIKHGWRFKDYVVDVVDVKKHDFPEYIAIKFKEDSPFLNKETPRESFKEIKNELYNQYDMNMVNFIFLSPIIEFRICQPASVFSNG